MPSTPCPPPPPLAPTTQPIQNPQPTLRKLYLSHALSAFTTRAFEFAAVIFLAAIFPDTLFFASCYALVRAAAGAGFSAQVGRWVDERGRLRVVRGTVVGMRGSGVAACGLLVGMVRIEGAGWGGKVVFAGVVVLAGVERVAFVGNSVAVERDWVVVVAEELGVPREELNSVMRRIDLACKLVAPLGVSLVDGWSNEGAIWVVLGMNVVGFVFEYLAIAQVYAAVPALASRKVQPSPSSCDIEGNHASSPASEYSPSTLQNTLNPWKAYIRNPAFLASFSLALLYFTVLSFGSQLTTYLLTLGLTPLHVSSMRLAAVVLELSATCAAPLLMRRIGAVRAGLWFINSQLLSTLLATSLFTLASPRTLTAGLFLVAGVILSRLGLWGFDLCVQYIVQEYTPEATRGSFSAVEASLQNLFELLSFAATMVWARPEQFQFPVWVSGGVVLSSAACFAGFVRGVRGHLVHFGRLGCWVKRRGGYGMLQTVGEEQGEQ